MVRLSQILIGVTALSELVGCTSSNAPRMPVPSETDSPARATPSIPVDPFAPDSPVKGTTSTGCARRTNGDPGRFGDFIVSGLQDYDETWTSKTKSGGPLSFTPRVAGRPDDQMTVTAANPTTHASFVSATNAVSNFGDGGRSF